MQHENGAGPTSGPLRRVRRRYGTECCKHETTRLMQLCMAHGSIEAWKHGSMEAFSQTPSSFPVSHFPIFPSSQLLDDGPIKHCSVGDLPARDKPLSALFYGVRNTHRLRSTSLRLSRASIYDQIYWTLCRPFIPHLWCDASDFADHIPQKEPILPRSTAAMHCHAMPCHTMPCTLSDTSHLTYYVFLQLEEDKDREP